MFPQFKIEKNEVLAEKGYWWLQKSKAGGLGIFTVPLHKAALAFQILDTVIHSLGLLVVIYAKPVREFFLDNWLTLLLGLAAIEAIKFIFFVKKTYYLNSKKGYLKLENKDSVVDDTWSNLDKRSVIVCKNCTAPFASSEALVENQAEVVIVNKLIAEQLSQKDSSNLICPGCNLNVGHRNNGQYTILKKYSTVQF